MQIDIKKSMYFSHYYPSDRPFLQASNIFAISNGQDSTFLFFLLLSIHYLQLKKKYIGSKKLIYCHHLWQKSNILSFWHTIQLASTFHFFFFITINCYFFQNENTKNIFFTFNSTVQSKKLSSLNQKKTTQENDARFWRLHSFKRYKNILNLNNSSFLLQGHTISDQIETIFFNSMRKSPRISQKKHEFQKMNSFRFIQEKEELFPVHFLKIKKRLQSKKSVIILLFYYYYFLQSENKKNYTSIKFSFVTKTETKKMKKNLLLFIWRPLISLKLYRNDIIFWNKYLYFPLIYDRLNKNILFSRNKIRLYILPFLQSVFQKNIEEFLFFMIQQYFYKNKSQNISIYFKKSFFLPFKI